jgi:hypothetical protein
MRGLVNRVAIAVYAEVPPIAQHAHKPVRRPADFYIVPEMRFDRRPRFLVSLFLNDREGLLSGVLRVLDEGLEDPQMGKVSFSIDGSLSSSVMGAFALAFIVRPVFTESIINTQSGTAFEVEIPELLKKKLQAGLRNVSGGSEAESVTVSEFEAGFSYRLFYQKRFSEYRFGLKGSCNSTDQLEAFASITAKFTKKLGQAGVPIAYLYFPESNGGPPELEATWVAIGVGAPSRAVDAFAIDLFADDLAKAHNMIFAQYDPILTAPDSQHRLRILGNHDNGQFQRLATNGAADAAMPVDIVFTQGIARVGYVADMLSADNARRLLGGSMTVLGGQTLSCWVLPSGEGNRFAEHLKSVNGGIPPRKNTPAPTDVSDPISLVVEPPWLATERRSPFWLAWKCSDKPGVLRRVVDATQDFVKANCEGRRPDFRYAISRVLTGERCAGKIQFTVPEDYADLFSDDLLSDLRRKIEQVLPLAKPGQAVWERDHRWAKESVIVRKWEPSEEPWASLLLRDFDRPEHLTLTAKQSILD